ncbi:Sec1 family protein [Onchocerca flexuosa]|uniref:Sec1 family protein n=2 Tax=Onchocerca flexuosa TaxID=387005 RepID=A0A238C382_9BILA|nr:Sec1 family protein [Onchocerca flexuosa]
MDSSSRSITDILSEANARILFGALDAIDGPKIITWDPTLIKQFNLVTTTEQLKQHKVVAMLQLDLSPGVPQAEHNHVVYILSAYNLSIINKLITCLKHARSINDSRQHHALIVPEASFMIRDTLKQNREASSILKTLESLSLRLFPLYSDFLTLLMHDLPSKLLLDNDWTELQKCASAVRQLELLVGCLPNLRCKGKWAAQIVEIVKKMRIQMNESQTLSEHNDFQISDIILIDRWIDPLTPLLIQLTYAGLVDEIFDIGATGNIKTSKLSSTSDSADAASEISLHDPLFKMIRDLHIKDVGKEIAKTLGTLRDERTRLKENPPSDSLAESKVFVRRLLDMQGSEKHADTHTLIAERLMSFISDDLRYSTFPKLVIGNDILQGTYGDRIIPQIENLILEAYNPLIVLRFIALQCLVAGGFKNATISAYERLFIQSYGGYYISLWIKLHLTGLLWERNAKVKYEYAPFDFQTAYNRMSCFVDEEHSAYGTTAYPYSGYIPLIVRYIEMGIQNSWRDWTTILSDDCPTISPSTYSIIFIIGGITQAELACLRKTRFSNKLLVHENITRKLEQLVVDMTRQLIANASNKEDVEVEVKMLFGKLVGSSKNAISENSINKNLCPMRRISGSFDATVTAIVSPKTSSVNHAQSITNYYSSPIQQITIEKDRTSKNGKIKEKRKSTRSSGSFDIVTFRGFVE